MHRNVVLLFGVLFFSTGVVASAASGVARIKATAADSSLSGTVEFTDTEKGLKVSARLNNVPPGKHGFHIHQFGDCGDMGKNAGSHYNPMDTPHGHILKDPMKKAHIGDMGNIEADESGNASLDMTIPGASLTAGKYTVGGRAVIVHENADDFGQPVGNAGGRIACGEILITAE